MSKKRISNIEFTMSLQNYDLIAYQRKNNLMNERFLFDCFSFFTNGARQVLCKKKILWQCSVLVAKIMLKKI